MKVTINLLPEERKREFLEKKTLAIIFKFFTTAFLAVILFSLFLFFCLWIIDIQIKSLKAQQTYLSENKKYSQVQEVQKFAEDYYQQTSRIEKILQQYNYYWDLLIDISRVVPKGIRLEEMTLESNAISLSGFSDNREILIKFKESLEKNDKLSKIESPISNFTSSENINFNFKAEIK